MSPPLAVGHIASIEHMLSVNTAQPSSLSMFIFNLIHHILYYSARLSGLPTSVHATPCLLVLISSHPILSAQFRHQVLYSVASASPRGWVGVNPFDETPYSSMHTVGVLFACVISLTRLPVISVSHRILATSWTQIFNEHFQMNKMCDGFYPWDISFI